jgi:(E)-4-hydroxy-3-methylbut-2-enyl-diphosphate synthase
MKSSNPQVMILAYRLLVAEMMKLGWDYPLHLGVTEAGEGEDGRIKSAMGIGTLLLDGIGDTIRVSLTEDAWHEIDPCRRLVQFARESEGKGVHLFEEIYRNIELIDRRQVILPKNVSMHRDGTVLVSATASDITKPDFYQKLGCDVQLGQPKLKQYTADNIVLLETPQDILKIQALQNVGVGVVSTKELSNSVKLLSLKEAVEQHNVHSKTERFSIKMANGSKAPKMVIVRDENPQEWEALLKVEPEVIVLAPSTNRLHYSRHFFEWIRAKEMKVPVILNFDYTCSKEDLVIQSSAELGSLLCDGLGEGVWITGPFEMDYLRNLSFSILQAARMRTTKTDFISCPSCGRTLFDLQEVSRRIRSRTAHLPGVKIAIMGCIVNGPGEMADADFGYVGSKPGMIDLYVGKECVEKDIQFSDADDRLVELIKNHGRWVEKEEQSP